jgi:hypothetical protein
VGARRLGTQLQAAIGYIDTTGEEFSNVLRNFLQLPYLIGATIPTSSKLPAATAAAAADAKCKRFPSVSDKNMSRQKDDSN